MLVCFSCFNPGLEMKFNQVEITQSAIIATRLHFAGIYERCIQGAKDGSMHVNDVEGYILNKEACISEVMQGDNDYQLGFMKRAYYLQEGEMLALLP
jgi:hypothetical protein